MKSKNAFKFLLLLQTCALLAYSWLAYMNDGPNLFGIFIDNLLELGWSGQFNLDFLCYLMLSALWVAWRNHFKPNAILLAAAAFVLGIVVFAPYLLWLTYQEKGAMKKILLGNR